MLHLTENEWRHAFSAWLRTGRVPSARPTDATERKFNPWHDPDDGRFTFRGTGVYYGRGASRSGDGPKKQPRPKEIQRRERSDGFPGEGGGFGGGSGGGTWEPPEPVASPATAKRTAPTAAPGKATKPARPTKPREQFRTVVRNGYTYQIDMRGRTRRVSGSITLAEAPRRSRTAQSRAGGPDRRTSDDGGHYIAARFAGPTDAFNHFAQDANFNRGGYRLLEDQWARARRAGKSVTVRIIPYYDGNPTRPHEIDVLFVINGQSGSQKFHNERSENRRGS